MFCANVPRRLVHCCERIAARSQQAGGGSAIRREELSHDVQPSLPGPCRPTGAAEASQEPRRTELTAAPYPCRLRSREGRRCLAPGRRCRATSAPPLLRRLAASLTTLAAARSNLQYPTLYICIACIATRSLTRAALLVSSRACGGCGGASTYCGAWEGACTAPTRHALSRCSRRRCRWSGFSPPSSGHLAFAKVIHLRRGRGRLAQRQLPAHGNWRRCDCGRGGGGTRAV